MCEVQVVKLYVNLKLSYILHTFLARLQLFKILFAQDLKPANVGVNKDLTVKVSLISCLFSWNSAN